MGCPAAHSFVGTTRVLLANGKTKLISRIRVGDKIANGVPGSSRTETHAVSRVIVTKTDHDFVRMTVKRVGKVVAAPAHGSTLTTTYHHPFYDVTRSAFVDADHVRAGDLLQSVNGGQAEITSTHLFQATTTTYDLTIGALHTYYVLAGDTPLLVHNCGDKTTHDVDNLTNNLDNGIYFHYTNQEGHAGIMADNGSLRIAANSAGKVHVTQEMGSPAEIEQNIFINSPTHSGRGDYVFAFRMPQGVELAESPLGQEMIGRGSLKIPAENVVFHGRNPF